MAAAGRSRGSAAITVAVGVGIGLMVGLLTYFLGVGVSQAGRLSLPIAIVIGLVVGASAAFRYRRQGLGTRRPG
jgi:hypothetical protein